MASLLAVHRFVVCVLLCKDPNVNSPRLLPNPGLERARRRAVLRMRQGRAVLRPRPVDHPPLPRPIPPISCYCLERVSGLWSLTPSPSQHTSQHTSPSPNPRPMLSPLAGLNRHASRACAARRPRVRAGRAPPHPGPQLRASQRDLPAAAGRSRRRRGRGRPLPGHQLASSALR